MNIVNLTQGSPEWHAHRLNYDNASDAPAMMGCSPYKTRAQLIKECATGLAEEVGAGTQRLFDAGHRFEALARPLGEQIIGEELSPVVATRGRLSASFDGITFMGDVIFEHKTLNDSLRYTPWDEGNGDHLPLHFRVQMEQQLYVSSAERALFMATKWAGDECTERRHCWYVSDPALRAQILAGWKQFEADVAAYKPAEVVPTVVAEPVEALPAVLVKVSGEIAITANFAAFEAKLREFLEHRLIREPKTDQDFADLDLQIKAMKGAEAALDAAEGQMLAQIASVDTAKKTKDMLAKLVRDNRLMAEKLLASEKERRKAEIVAAGQTAAREHYAALTARVGVPFVANSDFPGVIKGKRSLTSMEEAIDTELARVKIELNRVADLIDGNRKAMEAADAAGLFPDFAQVCIKPADDFANLIASRRAAAQARLDAERERIRAEEAARLEREAQARAAAEAQARADEAARLEREQREESERQARELQEARERSERAEAAKITQDTQESGFVAETSAPCVSNEAEPAQASPSESGAAVQAEESTARSVAPAPEVCAFPAPVVAAEAPTLMLGELWKRLGLDDREAFLASLGFTSTPAPKGTGKLYRASDVQAIRRAIAKRMTEAADFLEAA